MKFDPKTYGAFTAAALIPLGLSFIPSSVILSDGWKDLSKLPWIALPVVGFLGWRLNQTRIFFSAALLLLLLASRLLAPAQQLPPQLWALSLPFSMAMLFSFPEAPLFSQRSLLRLFLALLPLMLLYGFALILRPSYDLLCAWAPVPHTAFIFSDAAWIAILSFMGLSFWLGDLKSRPYLQALALAQLPLLLPKVSDDLASINALFSCAILLWAIFSMYWQRVYLDELTGIANRRALDERLAGLDSNYSLVMVDIDHFKKFNDSYGHDEGDNVLKLVARHISDGSGGRAYRYGGEEFCLVFEGWSGERAEQQADAIREALAGRKFAIRLPKKIRKKTSADDRGSLTGRSVNVQVTISMGVAGPDKNHVQPHEVIKAADECLYAAKEKGRNCVVRKKQEFV